MLARIDGRNHEPIKRALRRPEPPSWPLNSPYVDVFGEVPPAGPAEIPLLRNAVFQGLSETAQSSSGR
jgi:hypothetical protein